MESAFPPPRMATKLVRDNIPGDRSITSTREHYDLLISKLREESDEVARVRSSGELVEELADVMEVCETLAGLFGFPVAALYRAQSQKRAQRGSFNAGIVQEGNWRD